MRDWVVVVDCRDIPTKTPFFGVFLGISLQSAVLVTVVVGSVATPGTTGWLRKAATGAAEAGFTAELEQ